MFKCENCGIISAPCQPLNRIVTQRREKNYEVVVSKGRYSETLHRHGWEIVEEMDVCPQCFTALTGKEALIVEKKEKKFFPKFRKEYKNNNKTNKGLERVRDRERRSNRNNQNNYQRRTPQVEVINPIKTIK